MKLLLQIAPYAKAYGFDLFAAQAEYVESGTAENQEKDDDFEEEFEQQNLEDLKFVDGIPDRCTLLLDDVFRIDGTSRISRALTDYSDVFYSRDWNHSWATKGLFLQLSLPIFE